MPVTEAIAYYGEKEPKGEYVLCVSGFEESEEEIDLFSSMTLDEHVDYYVEKGFNKKEAIKKCAEDRNLSKREVYNMVMIKD